MAIWVPVTMTSGIVSKHRGFIGHVFDGTGAEVVGVQEADLDSGRCLVKTVMADGTKTSEVQSHPLPLRFVGSRRQEIRTMLHTPKPPEELYWYGCEIIRVIDGDTITADIDLGFGVWLHNKTLRLYGVDAPELNRNGQGDGSGEAAAKRLVELLANCDSVMIRTHKDRTEKYGRWLATIFVLSGGQWTDVNQAMVNAGHAQPAFNSR